jgi:hypothetical protein
MLRVSFELTAAGIVNRQIWAGPVDGSGSGETTYSLLEGEERVGTSSRQWSPRVEWCEQVAFRDWLNGPVGFFEAFGARILSRLHAAYPDLGRAAFDLELLCDLDLEPRSQAYELREYRVREGDLSLSLPAALNCLVWRQPPEGLARLITFEEETLDAAYPDLTRTVASLVFHQALRVQELFGIWINLSPDRPVLA